MKERFDAIVIGTGVGGLSAGCNLARAGLRVLMLEQHNLPGGVTTSFRRGRFEFEASVQVITEYDSPENPGPVRRFFVDELGVDIDFPQLKEGRACCFTESGERFVLPLNKEELIRFIEERVPGSAESVRAYLDFCDEQLAAVNYINAMDAVIKPVQLILKHKGLIAACGLTVQDVVQKFGIPPKALDYLNIYWTFTGLPMEAMSFPIFGLVVSAMSTTALYSPRKTTFEISARLAERFMELGGTLLYNTRAERILVENGRVKGVVTQRGEQFLCDEVYSNALPHNVFQNMIWPQSEVPAQALKNLNMRAEGTSFLSLYMGLDRSCEELGLNHFMYYFAKNGDTAALYERMKRLEPTDCFAGMCPNPLIPDASPEGTCILHLETITKSDAWMGITQREYFRKKHELAGDLIERAEKYLGVSIRPHIEEIEVATPMTFARYIGAYKGNVYAYDHRVFDSVVIKAMTQDKERLIAGLHFVGNAGMLISGFPSSILSGRLATVEQINEHGKRRGA